MSQEQYPTTDRAKTGSTPAHGPGAASELEQQRAEGDLPGQPTEDPFRRDDDEDEDPAADTGERHEERLEGER